MNLKRWKSAQKVERKHRDDVGHQLWDIKTGAEYFDRFFDVDLDFFQNKTVLAVGAGTGFIHNFDFDCHNIGIDPLMQHYDTVPEESSADCFAAAGEYLPFGADTFDVAFSFNVIDHCMDPDKVLEEVRRVLKDDGVFLLNSNIYEVPGFIRKQMTHIDPPHPYHFSSCSIRRRVENVGFTVWNEKNLRYRKEKRHRNIKMIVANYLFRMRRWSCHARLHS